MGPHSITPEKGLFPLYLFPDLVNGPPFGHNLLHKGGRGTAKNFGP